MTSLAAVVVGAVVAGACPGAEVVIHLRGSAEEVSGAVQSANEEAITLIQGGAPRSWRWVEVASIDGTTETDIRRWQQLGTDIWRARQRLERGDAPMAMAAAKRARENCGPSDRLTRMQADRALLRAASQAALIDPARNADLLATATTAALEVCALAAADAVKLPNGGEASTAGDLEAEFTTMMPPSLPPAFESAEAARALRERLAGLEPQIAAAELTLAYSALAELEEAVVAIEPVPRPSGARWVAPAWAERLLRAWRDACGGDQQLREKGRAALDSARTATPTPYDPWIDYAIGRSLARDARSDEAALRLLRVAARVGERTPLGRAAMAQAAECLRASGESICAQRLSDSLNLKSEGRTP